MNEAIEKLLEYIFNLCDGGCPSGANCEDYICDVMAVDCSECFKKETEKKLAELGYSLPDPDRLTRISWGEMREAVETKLSEMTKGKIPEEINITWGCYDAIALAQLQHDRETIGGEHEQPNNK